VFGNFARDRIASAWQEEADKLLPHDDGELDVNVLKWRKHADFLSLNAASCLPTGPTAYCYRCRKQCSICSTIVDAQFGGNVDVVPTGWSAGARVRNMSTTKKARIGVRTVARADHRVGSSSSSSVGLTGVMDAHAPKREVMLVAGGTECVDFANYGHTEGVGGGSMEAYNSFVLDIDVHRPLWIMVEISGLKDLVFWRERFPEYHFVGMEINPEGFGGGCRRTKLYCWEIGRAHV
jgi:hypothetical protein